MIPRPTHEVNVVITRFVEDHQPNIVEWRLTDIYGREWVFEGKSFCVSQDYFEEDSQYPAPGSLGCYVLEQLTDEVGAPYYRIDTFDESLDGVNIFDIRRVKPVSD